MGRKTLAKPFKKFKKELVLKIYRLFFSVLELSVPTPKDKLQSPSASGMSKGPHRRPFVKQCLPNQALLQQAAKQKLHTTINYVKLN